MTTTLNFAHSNSCELLGFSPVFNLCSSYALDGSAMFKHKICFVVLAVKMKTPSFSFSMPIPKINFIPSENLIFIIFVII